MSDISGGGRSIPILTEISASSPVSRQSGTIPPAIARLPDGSVLTGVIVGRDARGLTTIDTAQGQLRLKPDISLLRYMIKGTEVMLRLEHQSNELHARMLAINGTPLSKLGNAKNAPAPPNAPPSSGNPSQSSALPTQASTSSAPSLNTYQNLRPAFPTTPSQPASTGTVPSGQQTGQPALPVGTPLTLSSDNLTPRQQQALLQLLPSLAGTTQQLSQNGISLQVRLVTSLLPPPTTPSAATQQPGTPNPATAPAVQPGQTAQPGTAATNLSSGSTTSPTGASPTTTAPGTTGASTTPVGTTPNVLTGQAGNTPTSSPATGTGPSGTSGPSPASPPGQPSLPNAPGNTAPSSIATGQSGLTPTSQNSAPPTAANTSPTAPSTTTASTTSATAGAPPQTTAQSGSVPSSSNTVAPQFAADNRQTGQTMLHGIVRHSAPAMVSGITTQAATPSQFLDTHIGSFRLPASTPPLPVGTSLSVDILQAAPGGKPLGSAPTPIDQQPPRPLPELAQRWEGLEEASRQLQTAAPDAAAQLRQLIPQPLSARMVPTTLFFLAALGGGQLSQWLPPAIMQPLEQLAGGRLLRKLDAEFTTIRQAFMETSQQNWQLALVPMWDGERISPARFFLERENDDAQQGEDEHSRFVIELNLSQFGQLQLDGMVRKNARKTDHPSPDKQQHLGLMIRSHTPLPPEIRQEMEPLFYLTVEGLGITGNLAFDVTPHFPEFGDSSKMLQLMSRMSV